jgi:adenylate cyclase
MGEGLLRKEQVEQVFGRYVSPQVANKAIQELDEVKSVQLGGEHVSASVLFADIVSFTSMSEEMNPADVSQLLNEYFSNIALAVHFCNGHIDKYMGDCAMIVFGVPEERDDHAFLAVACSWMILELVKAMNNERLNMELRTVEFRIGVNGGTVLAGNMGSAERMEYTVVGDTVNLASRLSHAGEPGEIIITDEMYQEFALEHHTQSEVHGTIRLRGKKEPVALYEIHGIKGDFQQAMRDEIDRIMERYRATIT